MKIRLLALFFIAINFSFAQNLVLNPGFEDTLGCPDQIGQVSLASGWSSWGGTPDYYNACSNLSAPQFGVPVNNRGFQFAHSGNAYIGLFTFSIFTQNLREFVGRQLSSPMIIGQQYFVSFWANHADTSIVHLTTDKLGIKFSTVSFSLFNPDTVNNLAPVFSNTIISDTTNWVLIQGSFIADSAYTHLSIGNYFEDAQTGQSQIGTATANYAYYLIDDVCVSSNPLACPNETPVFENIKENVAKVYPNPACDIVSITFIEPFSNAGIKLINTLGQIVIEKTNILGSSVSLEITTLVSGIYFFEISEGNKIYRTKLIKN